MAFLPPPPPANPADCGAEDLWPNIERQLGVQLPIDYKQFINIYGNGEFYGFWGVISAFSFTPDGRSRLLEQNAFLRSCESNGMWYDRVKLFPTNGAYSSVVVMNTAITSFGR